MSPVRPPEFQQIELVCECRVNGERLRTRQIVVAAVWEDPEARKVIEEQVRQRLLMAVLDRWKPKIQVCR